MPNRKPSQTVGIAGKVQSTGSIPHTGATERIERLRDDLTGSLPCMTVFMATGHDMMHCRMIRATAWRIDPVTTYETDLAAELARRHARFATDAEIDKGSILPTPEASPFPGPSQATGASGGDPKPPMGYSTGPERMPGPTGRWGGRAGEHVDDAENPKAEEAETIRWGRWGGRGSEKAGGRDADPGGYGGNQAMIEDLRRRRHEAIRAGQYERAKTFEEDIKRLGGDAEIATDPPVSEQQRKAMHAAASGHSTLGIPKNVGEEFVESIGEGHHD